MSEIDAYRQIVELQVEIVRLSEKNAELENRCKQAHAELISQHKKLSARSGAAGAVANCVAGHGNSVGSALFSVIRSTALKPILQRVWQSVI